ncbi:NAD(P)-dependent oxidoreductase [Mangrovicoccus ximenensis]|uniref:NAD(P)-dependent oxidoreductase n=1 Tax=Mangrovicoccus ximenensis TaxID=1911570 RepID=UPI001F3B5FBD|nr:NAD(P)-dependent oxidoreductase [Mangrovicoccus ximenensis]
MSGKETIGFIGVGPMGHGMAANILKAGHPLVVKGNRNRAPVEDLLAQGATEAASPRGMAEACGIVHLCLSNSDQVEAAIRGPDGILASGRAGLVVIDCSTSNPVSTAVLAAELEAAGMVLVDAPLGRTPKEAEAGTLDAMVGAPEEVFARVKPVIGCWAGNITHVGPTGAGHRMKLIMNFISMGYPRSMARRWCSRPRSGCRPKRCGR